MNFFEHQDQARRNTKKLVALFALAVICLIAITTVFISFMIYASQSGGETYFSSIQAIEGQHYSPLLRWFNPEVCVLVAAGVISVVIIASLFKWMQLSGGGKAVAESMGGRLIHTNTDHDTEKKILNVVEEMAIASGTPVPSVYLIDSPAINAFAAGHDIHDAVIGVTQGCIELLNRDELQGVVAHEFSHILHGDMRLNMRLVGVLHGILAIGLIGRLLLNSSRPRYGYHTRYRSSRNNKGSGIAVVGLGLVVIGYVGTFFGNLIKANVSRQREFLADASAVQFTRNPEGIGQALQKIGGYSYGSQINHGDSEEFSHLFFGEALSFSQWMATHPPLNIRIERVLPQWDGNYPAIEPPAGTTEHTELTQDENMSQFSAMAHSAATDTAPSSPSSSRTSTTAIDNIGDIQPENITRAKTLLTEIPKELKENARDSFTGRALIYALLMKDSGEAARSVQWDQLKQGAHPVVFRHTQQLMADIESLATELMLPLFECTLPALKTLSPSQYQVFKKNVMLLIRADKKVSVFEWCLYRMLINNLETTSHSTRAIALQQANSATEDLLSCLCLIGHTGNKVKAQEAFQKAAEISGMALSYQSIDAQHFQKMDQALQILRRVKPLQKPQLLKAIATAIKHDGQVSLREQELFRAIADNLDCPVPPLSASQSLI